MRRPTNIKIVSSIVILVVFLFVPLTSYADMLGALQRSRCKCSDLEQQLKSACQNRVLEFHKLSRRQVRQEQRRRSRPPKTPQKILDKFVRRIQQLAAMIDASPTQHMADEQAIEPETICLPDYQSSSLFSLAGTHSFSSLSVLRL